MLKYRTLDVKFSYDITGIGTCYQTTEPDPPWEPGELVKMNGTLYKIDRIERHPVANGPVVGMSCGVTLRSWLQRDRSDEEYQREIEELAAWFNDQWENHRDELPMFTVDVETWDRMMEDYES